MMGKPQLQQVRELHATRFIKLYELAYKDGARYFEASRRASHDLLAAQDESALESMLPDAISVCLVVVTPHEDPRMVLNYEYRYPTGQFVLSVPSGLIDQEDIDHGDAIVRATVREVAEETGIHVGPRDRVTVINQLLFNTPGFTDESTALVCAVVHMEDLSSLTQEGSVGSERFDGFELLTRAQAREVLRVGRDPHGRFYPMVTWAALSYFVFGAWR